MKLSHHFTLAELTHSGKAAELGLDNTPPPLIVENLRALAETLEQVRALVGRPVIVSSGYRSQEVNKAVGGGRNSAHMLGLAADIKCSGPSPLALARLIRDSGIEYDQLIREPTWAHIGLSLGKPRGELLTARRTAIGMTYTPGIG